MRSRTETVNAAARVAKIRADFQRVDEYRLACAQNNSLSDSSERLKQYQLDRLRATHRVLFNDGREARAATFFLEELYGLSDFSDRDREFQRVVPSVVRWFPEDVVETVERLGSLYALSEGLDLAMARELMSESIITAPVYRRAWCVVSTEDVRAAQRTMIREVGQALGEQTRSLALRRSLRLMRGPARLAGLGQLQAFLEKGFDTFGALNDPRQFVDGIVEREDRFARGLFNSDTAVS